jgi:YfiH family protein
MPLMHDPGWIPATWPAPPGIRAGVTSRVGGVSRPPYASLNLGLHVGDDPAAVSENRTRLRNYLALPTEPHWLNQVHGIHVSTDSQACIQADAGVTHQPGQVCVVMTADCLPVLLCDRAGTVVAAAHAGWRGLAAGVIPETVLRMQVDAANIMAWLGPAIGPRAFEVGDDVRNVYLDLDKAYAPVFRMHSPGKWLMDIYAAARLQLAGLGVTQVYGGEYCTYENTELFYSYRRERETGRMASLIWIQRV